MNPEVGQHVRWPAFPEAMDVESSPGRTLLDDSLVMWTNESGWATHGSRGIPVVVAGTAGGKLRTGQYIDLTNRTTGQYVRAEGGSTGLMYGQWLATVLQTMGMQRDQFQNIPNNAMTGYGAGAPAAVFAQTHARGVRENASELLPYIAVGA